jgi:glycosyltransferase A (GT-A) superfamily protein (DUF2064 family)
MTVAVVLMAKVPRPGRSKTRLTPPCTPDEAAALAAAALADTLDAVRALEGCPQVLALDDPRSAWRRRGLDVIGQRGDGLAERLGNVVRDLGQPVVIIGMDTPQITPTTLAALVAGTELGTAQIGLACDGGWWGIGLPTPSAEVFSGVPMSRPDTGHRQLRRLRERYGEVAIGPTLRDVDHWTDALEVADLVPTGSRFAREVRRVAAATAKRRTVGVS